MSVPSVVKRLLLALMFVCVTMPLPRADASCGPSGNLREEIDDADAVIVGTVTEAGVADRGVEKTKFGRPLRWTIDVDEDLKDNVGERMSFHAGTTGSWASSQFSARDGERVGLLLSRRDGGFSASSCDKRPPEAVLAAAGPLAPPRGRGVPVMFAAGGFGEPRVALLDARGAATHYGTGKGDARIAVCPGERLFVEAVSETSDEPTPAWIEVRDARTMRVVRRERLPQTITGRFWHRPFAVACRNEQAEDVLVGAEAGIYSARVVRQRLGRWTTAYHDKARAVTFVPQGFAVIKHGERKFELVVHAPDGKVRSRIGPLPSFKHLSISEPVPLVADASGRYVAGANEEPESERPNLFVADVREETVVRKHVQWVSGLAWAGSELVVAPLVRRNADGYVDPTKGGDVHIYDTRLVRLASWGRWHGQHPVVIGDRLFGVRDFGRDEAGLPRPPVVVSAPYRTGPEKPESSLGDAAVTQLVALEGVGPTAQRGRPGLTWTAIGLAVFLVTLAAIVLRSRLSRRDRTEP